MTPSRSASARRADPVAFTTATLSPLTADHRGPAGGSGGHGGRDGVVSGLSYGTATVARNGSITLTRQY